MGGGEDEETLEGYDRQLVLVKLSKVVRAVPILGIYTSHRCD